MYFVTPYSTSNCTLQRLELAALAHAIAPQTIIFSPCWHSMSQILLDWRNFCSCTDSSKRGLAERTCRFVGCGEPLVETGGVELVFTGLAGQFGERMVGCVDDGIADGAFLYPLKLSVHVLLPHLNSLQQRSILES